MSGYFELGVGRVRAGRAGRVRTSAIQEGIEVSYREVQGLVDQLQGAVLLRHPVHEVLTHLDAARKKAMDGKVRG